MKINSYTKYISTTVSDLPHYTTKISLMGVPLNLKCSYNSRNKSRWVTITDRYNNPVLTQTFLKIGKQCEFNFLADRLNLSFYLTLKPKDLNKKFADDYDYLNWSEDFELYFVGRSYELEERLRVNGRGVYVKG